MAKERKYITLHFSGFPDGYRISEEIALKNAVNSIPSWINKGQSMVLPEKFENWKKCVIKCVKMYCGDGLNTSLEIMEALNNGASIEEGKKILKSQNHSNVSENTVRNIILKFHVNGPEFWEATASSKISLKMKIILEMIKLKNMLLIKKNERIIKNS